MDRSTVRNGVVLAITLFVIAPVIFVFSVLNFLSADRTRSAEQNWDATLGTWDEIMHRYPATEANAAALELERLAAALGITVSPRHVERAQTTAEAKAAFDQVRRQVHSYHRDQLARVRRGEVDEPPAVLLDYTNAHEAELQALRRHLLQSGIPVWESDLSKVDAAPLPNLLGQLNLQKLLTSVALAQIHAGDTAGALDSIHASWSLSRSLRDSPFLICQLIYLSATKLQLGALRHVRDVPGVWVDRIEEHDFRRSFITALQLEGRFWLHRGRNLPILGTPDPWGSGNASEWLKDSATLAVGPYLTLCLADISDRWRKGVDRLNQVKTLCDHDLSERGADMTIEIARWNRLGGMVIGNFSVMVDRVARLELDRELLLLAMAADAARRSAGAWPAPDSVRPVSANCPEDRWIYTRSGEALEIALSRDIQWPKQVGPLLPHRILLD